MKLNREKPLVLGVSYDPVNDHVAFWVNGAFVMRTGSPYVPRCAASAVYKAAFGPEAQAVRMYSVAATYPRCSVRPAAGDARGVPLGAAAYGFTRRIPGGAALNGADGFYIETRVPAAKNGDAPLRLLVIRTTTGTSRETPSCSMEIDVSAPSSDAFGSVRNTDPRRTEPLRKTVRWPTDGIDRLKSHTAGVAFDPATLTVTWWLDGRLVGRATAPFVPVSARDAEYVLSADDAAGCDYAVYGPHLCR